MSVDEAPFVATLLKDNNLPSEDFVEHISHFYVGVDPKNRVVGAVGIEHIGESGLLRSLTIEKSFQGHGLGKALTEQIEKYGVELGLRDLYLLTDTAEKFFRTLGYEEVSRDKVPAGVKATKEFSSICPSSSTVMKKAISNFEN